MKDIQIETVNDVINPLKIGNLYILTSELKINDSNQIIFSENYPSNSELLGKVYYFSLALWDEIRSDQHTIKRNCDLSLNEPFTVMGVEGCDIYNVIQTTDQGIKMGHIKIINNNPRTKSSMYVAFLIGQHNESI